MKIVRWIPTLCALAVSVSACAQGSFTKAQNSKISGQHVTKTLSVTLDYYATITITGALAITIDDAGLSGSYTSNTASFTGKTNYHVTLAGSVTTLNGAPGTWTATPSITTASAGSFSGTLSAGVTGLTTTNSTAKTYNMTVTLTVTQS